MTTGCGAKADIACPGSGEGGAYILGEFAVAFHETNPSRFIMRVLVLFLLGLSLLSCDEEPEDSFDSDDDLSVIEREMMKANSINPETSIRLLRPEELSAYTPQQLRLVRNEIFARHGYVFTSKDLNRYFDEQVWYEADSSFTEEMLTEVERQNIQALREEEEQRDGAPATLSTDSDTASSDSSPESKKEEALRQAKNRREFR